MVNYIKNNVLLIALLAIVIYQQFVLNDLLSYAAWNEHAILQTKDMASDIRFDVEQMRADLEYMRVELGVIDAAVTRLPLLID